MSTDQGPDAPAMDLNKDKTDEFGNSAHSADQPTATDQPVVKPKSSEADPMQTNVR